MLTEDELGVPQVSCFSRPGTPRSRPYDSWPSWVLREPRTDSCTKPSALRV